jgi:hypothetical protein
MQKREHEYPLLGLTIRDKIFREKMAEDIDHTIVICGIDTRLKFKVQGL